MKYLQDNIDDSLEFQLRRQLFNPLYRLLRDRLDWQLCNGEYGIWMLRDKLLDPLYIQVYKQVYWNLYSQTRTYEIYTK